MPVAAPSNPEPATATPAPTQSHPRRQPLQLALILVAAFMVVLDFSIVNVALPSIERELHMPADAVQWIVTGYAISFGGLLILGGRAADILGRRRMFVIGLVAFAMASLAGGLAQDPMLLIAARVVQGAGAAIVAPAALSLITTGFPEGPERTRAIGLYGAVSSAQPDLQSAWPYDAIGVLSIGINKAGSTDPDKIRDAMLSIKGYKGAEGEYNFDQFGDGLHGYNIVRNDKGTIVFDKHIEFTD